MQFEASKLKGSAIHRKNFDPGVIEIFDPKKDNVFKVNGQRIKPLFTTKPEPHVTFELDLCDPVCE